jgi:hypothetical protein
MQAPQSKHIADDVEDEWEVIAEYATKHQQAMDAHDIVDDIYIHAEKFMYESTVMQPDYVGKPEDLYLWCLTGESKTCLRYACPIHYSCECDTCIRITETKQTLQLETIRVHDQHSHTGTLSRGKMHARKSAPGVDVFSRPESEGTANDEAGGWSSIKFSVSSF